MNPTLFDDQREKLPDAMTRTAASFNSHGAAYNHWALSFSGGKDSTTVATVLAHLISIGEVQRPKSIHVMYADTGMEALPLHINALNLLDILRDRYGFETEVVRPALDDRFFVYMLGRGVPPPQPGFRWCVGNLKLKPMEDYLRRLHETCGERFITFTGVRQGESAVRDNRLAIACTKDGAECSQGRLEYSPQAEKVTDLCHPIIHWRVCQIWEWLIVAELEHQLPTYLLAATYGGDEAEEINARTGCVQCNVAKKDMATENLSRDTDWGYLEPLKRLKAIYAELSSGSRRHRKWGGETNADGSLVKNQNRLGPLTMEARQWGLDQVLSVQQAVNEAAIATNRPLVTLISDEELERIRWSWDEGLYPQRWDGTEPTGDILMPRHFSDGSVQPLLFESL